MELLYRTKDLWESPAQFAVMSILCFRDHDKRGFAAPSKDEIARTIGVKVGYIKRIFWQLEGMHALERLGPDREFNGRQRFVVSIEKAIFNKKSGFAVSSGDPLGSPGGIPWDPGGDPLGSRGGSPGIPPWSADVKTVRQERQPPGATAPPRLPLFPLDVRPEHPEQPAIVAARAYRLKKLRHRVAGLARAILINPALGRSLLDGEIASSIDALVEATKRLCAQKRVAGYAEVVHAMCTSELFKVRNPGVINGSVARPRNRAVGGSGDRHRS